MKKIAIITVAALVASPAIAKDSGAKGSKGGKSPITSNMPDAVNKAKASGTLFVDVPKTSDPVKFQFKDKTYVVESGQFRPIPFGATNIELTTGTKLITFADPIGNGDLVRSVYIIGEDFVLKNLEVREGDRERLFAELPKDDIIGLTQFLDELDQGYRDPFNVLEVSDGN